MDTIIEEDKKYWTLSFKNTYSGHYSVRGYFTLKERNECIDFHEGKEVQSKLIGVDDTNPFLT